MMGYCCYCYCERVEGESRIQGCRVTQSYEFRAIVILHFCHQSFSIWSLICSIMTDARIWNWGLGNETKSPGVVTVLIHVVDKSLRMGECNVLVKKSTKVDGMMNASARCYIVQSKAARRGEEHQREK